jgi:cysteinyl-tRNA synthetase
LRAWADLKFQPNAHQANLNFGYKTAIENISVALANDLNTSVAISEISKLVNISDVEGIDGPGIQTILDDVDALLGLGLAQRPDVDQKLKDLIQKREVARTGQDWDGADQARTELSKAGVVVKDTKFGPIWQRI